MQIQQGHVEHRGRSVTHEAELPEATVNGSEAM